MKYYNVNDFWKDGKLKCACCKEFKDPKTEFGKASALYQNGPRKGYKSYCKKCTKERINHYRHRNVNAFKKEALSVKPEKKKKLCVCLIVEDFRIIQDLIDLDYIATSTDLRAKNRNVIATFEISKI